MKSLAKVLVDFAEFGEGQRLGQYFYNRYLRFSPPWPELFYADYNKSKEMISDWLVDNCYTEELPK